MIVALNNKCNLTKEEFLAYQKSMEMISTSCDVILCPSTIHLSNYHLTTMSLGSQNVSKNTLGAHTGEISAEQLHSYGVKYCIVGHSERRQEQQETSEEVNEKIKQLLSMNIVPILCVGETEQERQNNIWREVIEKECKEASKDLNSEEIKRLIIAYEPIWSIGTGRIPTLPEIEEVYLKIKEHLPNNKILYGGSANETNIDYLKTADFIDGYLVGGLSLKPEKLAIFFQKLEN